MTTVTFRMEGDRITGFDSKGHLVEATINDVLGLAASVKVREEDASISLRLPGGLSPTAESTCQTLMTGLMVYFAQLHDEYPANIEVLEED